MSTRPRIFISAVSKELCTARQLIANTLTFLGYEPVWQEIFGTEHGDVRDMLIAFNIDIGSMADRLGASKPTPWICGSGW